MSNKLYFQGSDENKVIFAIFSKLGKTISNSYINFHPNLGASWGKYMKMERACELILAFSLQSRLLESLLTHHLEQK